jgi:hypothetical protein
VADEPRAYTDEEVREQFLEKVYDIKEFWEKETKQKSTKDKLEGCIFSILALLDGSSINFPAVALIASPHSDDEEYHKKLGENWIEDGTLIGDNVELHDEWQRLRAEKDGTIE